MRLIQTALVSALLCGCMVVDSPLRAATIVDERALTDEHAGADWLSTGRTYSERRYSPLAQIDDKNVHTLGLSWFLDLKGERTLEATPLAIDGVLYFSGAFGRTFAVDARSRRQLWKFDPESGNYRPEIFRFSGSLGGHRGVAYWQGRIYVAAIDGRLFALDAKSGKVVWYVQTLDDPKGHKTISGSPRVFRGKVIIGQTGDLGSRGYVTAYDARTGAQRWRFYTVPGDPTLGFENEAMAAAARTWTGQWWKSGGNASVWDGITYDPEFGRIYLGTANWIPEPGAGTALPPGDHLFVSSVIALDADTGKYLWHYQETPGGNFDYDSNMSIVLADLIIAGTPRKVLLHAPKNGFFYVIDRSTGKLISAEKFSKVTWADHIDLGSGRPVEITTSRELWPSFLGAHSWQPMSFNSLTGLVYIPTMRLGSDMTAGYAPITPQDDKTATLLAWDPVAQAARWEVGLDSYWNGGTMTTAGNLVFQGTARGELAAYNARSGERLWHFNAGLGIVAAPISYQVDETQFVSILVGYGGAVGTLGKRFDYGWRFNEQPRRLLTFALGGKATLPPGNAPRYSVNAADDPAFVIDGALAAKGSASYASATCYYCHGPQLENTGSFAPDLRESALAMNWMAFKSVVQGGALAAAGMPRFADLSDDDTRAIFMYIRQRSREAARLPPQVQQSLSLSNQ
jgi:quinohemoprotein ethanol dehydrogenase